MGDRHRLDTRRIVVFILVAYALAWAVGLGIYLTGGLAGSPELIPGTGLTLALALLSTVYMGAPALAHVLARWSTGEGWEATCLQPHLRRSWPWWGVAWLLPAVVTIAGAVAYFLLFPRHFDPELGTLRAMLEGRSMPSLLDDPRVIVVLQLLQAVILAPVINGVFAFGEEFGWRGYLQPKLMPLGWRTAVLLVGVVWGLWHAPLIAMGHNYGRAYPGAPWLGILAMVWFSVVLAVIFGWLTARGRSVWPAVIAHGATNGIAAVPIAFVQNDPNPLLGPLPVGLVGGIGWTVVAVYLFVRDPNPAGEP